MGQVIFLVVFVGLALATTAWAAADMRHRGQASDLADLTLKLLAFLGGTVLVLSTATGALATGAPPAVRIPVGLAAALAGLTLLVAHLRGRPRQAGAERALGGILLLAVAAAALSDSLAALTLVGLAAWTARSLRAARRDRDVTGRAWPAAERWTAARAASGGPADTRIAP